MLIFVAKILWSTTHAPQNTDIGAPQMSFSLLVGVSNAFASFFKSASGTSAFCLGHKPTKIHVNT
jgi:hypothetical protein